MVVRMASICDLDALFDLETICLGEDPWSRDSLKDSLQDPACPCFVAEEEGVVVGYVLGRLIPNEAEIYRVATLPHMRRRGVGRGLIDTVLADGQEQGCDTYFLEVRASNTGARGLYTACHFEELGVRRGYYRNPKEDGIMMRLICEEGKICSF